MLDDLNTDHYDPESYMDQLDNLLDDKIDTILFLKK